MQYPNRKIIVALIFSMLLLIVGVLAYTAGRINTERNFDTSQVEQITPVRLAGGIVGTWGFEHIFYTTYCGSSCLGFEVANITTGEIWKGVLSFMSDDEGRDYTLFDDWNGGVHRFEGEFDSVSGREHGEKLILDFTIKDEKTGESILHLIEF